MVKSEQASKRGKSSRRKGHQFERDVANALKGIFPGARRHLEYQGEEADGRDIVGTGKFKFQCKRLKKYSPVTAISEIQCAPELGDVPILVTAGDFLPALAVLPFDDLLRLLKNKSE
jgi:hypothetical protein